jgi:hypothetical protein
MYLHEMWMYERFMSILNGYVSTRACPEASMVEGYLTEEAIESGGPFCNRVLKDQVAIGLPPSRHEGRLTGRGRMGKKHCSQMITIEFSRHITASYISYR